MGAEQKERLERLAARQMIRPVRPPMLSTVEAAPEPQARSVMEPLDPSKSGEETTVLLDRLKERVIGHDEICEELAQAVQRHRAGMCPANRPVGIYLLVGPTGSGKTHIVKTIATLVTGSADSPLRIDCAEFGQSHEVAKLTGAPPGYLGHRETPAILNEQAIRRQWSDNNRLSFILFDEIDKANPRMMDLLLGIFDNGKLKVGDNTTTDFSNSIILMTANTGAAEMQEALQPKLGFAAALPPTQAAKAGLMAEAAAKKRLRPELFNRLDKILVFSQLTEDQMSAVCRLEIADLEGRMLRGPGVGLTISQEAREFITKDGFDLRYGARHLKRSIHRNLEKPIANLLTSNQLLRNRVLRVELEGGKLRFFS